MAYFVKKYEEFTVGTVVFIQKTVALTSEIDIIPTYSDCEYEGNIGTIMSKSDYCNNHAVSINGKKLRPSTLEHLIPVKLADSSIAILVSPDFLFKEKSQKLTPLIRTIMKEMDADWKKEHVA